MRKTIEQAVAALRRELGDNLYFCCLYGSAVRGNAIAGVSDLNLLIVLERSDPEAQDAVARAIGPDRGIDPFVLGREGLARSVRAFAAKFSSIKRNYRVLCGADPLDVKKHPDALTAEEAVAWHARFFPVVDAAIHWIEANWPPVATMEI